MQKEHLCPETNGKYFDYINETNFCSLYIFERKTQEFRF